VFTSLVPNDSAARLLIRTLRASFRYVTVIRPRAFGIFMMASQSPIRFNASSVIKVFGSAAARADLAGAPDYRPIPATSWPAALHRMVWLTNSQVSAFAGSGPLLTDDHPLTEYFFLHNLGSQSLSGPPKFERAALETGFVVVGLLVLLIIGLGLESLSRRRMTARPS
jgi:hypothetical protein